MELYEYGYTDIVNKANLPFSTQAGTMYILLNYDHRQSAVTLMVKALKERLLQSTD